MPLIRQHNSNVSPALHATSLALIAALALAGCGTKSQTRTLGGVVGAVGGGLLGSLFGKGKGRAVFITLGAAIGAIYGPDILEALTPEDQRLATDTIEETVDSAAPGETRAWSNPDSGNAGNVRAGETYVTEANGDCRDFETTVFTQDGEQTSTGTACRGADGTWSVVKEPTA